MINPALSIPWCPSCHAHHATPPPWCPFRQSVGAAAGSYYEADDPASYAGGVLPASLTTSTPIASEDVKKAQTNGILLGLAVGVAGAALYYYAAKTAR
jgi:hypothetical protein